MNVGRNKLIELASKLRDRAYRHGYLAKRTKALLAGQIRALRGDMRQSDFGDLIGKPQSVVSRLENQEGGSVNLQTLVDIAQKLDIGLLVQFVDYPTFARFVSQETMAIAPARYSDESLIQLVREPDAGSARGPRQ